jgi:hypothetical protein
MAVQEDIFYEGGPAMGDLIFHLVLGLTVVCLPLAVGATVRALWLRYRITSRRISITSGWMGRERSDIIYSEVSSLVTVPRGLGAWGDMVLTLKDGSRLELRAMPRFRETANYINEQIASRGQKAAA